MPYYITNYAEDRTAGLYAALLALLEGEGLYRDPGLTARELAGRLGVNPCAISAAVAYKTDSNFNRLVARIRIREACRMLRSKKHAKYTAEEIGLRVGFGSRQAFYKCFAKEMAMTPVTYRNATREEREKVDKALRLHL